MAYIWENYDSNNYYYIPKYKQSYYEEVWENSKKYVPVNIYNRFTDIFFPESLTEQKDELIELDSKYKNNSRYKDIVNVILHQLVLFDRMRGITISEIKMSIVYDNIINGYFGADLKKDINELVFSDLYVVLNEYVKAQTITDTVFDEVLHLLFGKVIIYNEKSTGKTLIYIEKIRNNYREKLFSVAKFLFADMDLIIEVFWANEHFGIIGNSSTMKIDQITIY